MPNKHSDDDFDLDLSDEEPMTPPHITAKLNTAVSNPNVDNIATAKPMPQPSRPAVSAQPTGLASSVGQQARPAPILTSAAAATNKPLPSPPARQQPAKPAPVAESKEESDSDWDDDSDDESEPAPPSQAAPKQPTLTKSQSAKPSSSLYEASPPFNPAKPNLVKSQSQPHSLPSSKSHAQQRFDDFDLSEGQVTQSKTSPTSVSVSASASKKKKKPEWESDSVEESEVSSSKQSQSSSHRSSSSPKQFSTPPPSHSPPHHHHHVSGEHSPHRLSSMQPLVLSHSQQAPPSPTLLAAQRRLTEQSEFEHAQQERRRQSQHHSDLERDSILRIERAIREESDRRRQQRLDEESALRHEMELRYKQSIEQQESKFQSKQLELERTVRETRLIKEQVQQSEREEKFRDEQAKKLKQFYLELEEKERLRLEFREKESLKQLERFALFESEREKRMGLYEREKSARDNAFLLENQKRKELLFLRMKNDEINREKAKLLSLESERLQWESEHSAIVADYNQQLDQYQSLLSKVQSEHEDRIAALIKDYENRLVQSNESFELERIKIANASENASKNELMLVKNFHQQQLDELTVKHEKRLIERENEVRASVEKQVLECEALVQIKTAEIALLNEKIISLQLQSETDTNSHQSAVDMLTNTADMNRAELAKKLDDKHRTIEELKLGIETEKSLKSELSQSMEAMKSHYELKLKDKDTFIDRLTTSHTDEIAKLEFLFDDERGRHSNSVQKLKLSLNDYRSLIVSKEAIIEAHQSTITQLQDKCLSLTKANGDDLSESAVKFAELKETLSLVNSKLHEAENLLLVKEEELIKLNAVVEIHRQKLTAAASDRAAATEQSDINKKLAKQLSLELNSQKEKCLYLEEQYESLLLKYNQHSEKSLCQINEQKLKNLSLQSQSINLRKELDWKSSKIQLLSTEVQYAGEREDKMSSDREDEERALEAMRQELTTLRSLISEMKESNQLSASVSDDFELKTAVNTTATNAGTRLSWPFYTVITRSQSFPDSSASASDDVFAASKAKLREIELRLTRSRCMSGIHC